MCESGSKECLNNAERLLKDAVLLFENKSFGSALSLSITALEEIGKAIILDLTSLNYTDKRIALEVMRRHPPKKLILKAIRKGIILRDRINRESGDYSITIERLEELQRMLKSEIGTWETERTSGLYVQVDVENECVKSSPMMITAYDARKAIDEARDILEVGKVLCKVFRDFVGQPRVVNNMRIDFPKRDASKESYDNDGTVSYDEA